MTIREKAEEMARFFHDEYETLAGFYNYETRKDTKEFDKNSPNGKLMIAVCESWIIYKLDEVKY